MEIVQRATPDQGAVSDRRMIRDQEARVPVHLLEPVVASQHAAQREKSWQNYLTLKYRVSIRRRVDDDFDETEP